MNPSQVVNPASVPQRSLFRYPGGKTWLVPRLRQWLRAMPRPQLLVEPFAGGGIISLTAVAEDLVEQVLLVELDAEVAAVWEVIVAGRGRELGEAITDFPLQEDTVQELLENPTKDPITLALKTIVRNRVQRGGILAPGAGRLRTGENNKGLSSRWYPETLAKRLQAIDGYQQQLTFQCADGIEVLEQHTQDTNAVFFIDPPYSASRAGKNAGKRLYRHHQLDHRQLFKIASELQGQVLLTYDNDPEVRQLATEHGFQYQAVLMRNTHHAQLEELLISRDLSWLSDPDTS